MLCSYSENNHKSFILRTCELGLESLHSIIFSITTASSEFMIRSDYSKKSFFRIPYLELKKSVRLYLLSIILCYRGSIFIFVLLSCNVRVYLSIYLYKNFELKTGVGL